MDKGSLPIADNDETSLIGRLLSESDMDEKGIENMRKKQNLIDNYEDRESKMTDIKYYKYGLGTGDNFYCIDSNILINIGKFYFNGKCGLNDNLTEQIRNFIILCRANGALKYDNALLEISYDSGTNEINTDVMNKFMMVIDALFMNCSDEEVLNHTPQIIPFCKKRVSGEFNSIFDCRLPQFTFKDEIDSINMFYLIYLYFIKIYHLTSCDIKPMEKVELIYNYMTREINCFMGHEFILGQMVYIGTDIEKNIAEGIMKFGKIRNGKSAIRIIINALFDIMSFRQMSIMVDIATKVKVPLNCIFVTYDKDLQNYIELNSDFRTVINGDKITNTFRSDFVPEEKYMMEWKKFYNTMFANAERRFMEYHLNKRSDVDMEKILKEIHYYENIIFN